MRDRARGRDTGRGRSRLHAGSPMWDSIPGPQDHTTWAEGGAKPLSHLDCPLFIYLRVSQPARESTAGRRGRSRLPTEQGAHWGVLDPRTLRS